MLDFNYFSSRISDYTPDISSSLWVIKLLRPQKKYSFVWKNKPENAGLRMMDEMPALEEVPERAIVSDDA